MKQFIVYKLLYILSLISIIGFFVLLAVDWHRYNDTLNSAPFYAFAIIRGIEFLIPSLTLFITAKIIKR